MADLALRINITARNKAGRSLKSIRRALSEIDSTSTRSQRRLAQHAKTEERAVRKTTRARQDAGRAVQRQRRGVRALTLEEAKRNEKIREQNRLIKAQARQQLGIRTGRAGVDPDAAATNLNFAGAGLQRAGDAGTRFFLTARDDALEFSKSVAEVTTITDQSRDEIEELAKEMSRTYGGSPAEQARAFYDIISSGSKNAADDLDAANKLAVAGVTDSKSAFAAINAIMKPYADSVGSAADANELLFQTVKDGRTTIPELAESLPRVTAISAAAGGSVEEVLAALSAITSETSTRDATTQIAGGFTKVIKSSKMAKKEFGELKKGSDTLAEFATIGEAVEGLGFKGFLDAAKASSQFDAESFSKLFEDIQGLRGVLSLDGAAGSKFEDNLASLKDDTKVFGDALRKQMEDPSRKAEKQMAKLKIAMIELGDKAIPVIAEAAEKIIPILDKMLRFADKHPEMIKLALGAAVGSAVVGRGLQGMSALAGMTGGFGFQGFAGNRGRPAVKRPGMYAPGMPAPGGEAGGPGLGTKLAKAGNAAVILAATFTAAYQTMKMIDEKYLGLSDWIAGVGKEDETDRNLHGGRTEFRGLLGDGFLKEGQTGHAALGQRGIQEKVIADLRRQIDDAETKRSRSRKAAAGLAATGVGGLIFGAKARAETEQIKDLEHQLATEEAALAKLDGEVRIVVEDGRTVAETIKQFGRGGPTLEVDGDTV